MVIMRDGNAYTLTDLEILSVRKEEHRKDIRCAYDDAVQICEDNEWISFASWADGNHGEYCSEDDFRSDYIDKLTEDYLDREDLYDYDPDGFRSHDYVADVLDFATDEDIRKDV